MNVELFITRRLLHRSKFNFSRPIIFLSIVSIALGISVMLISISVVNGFQHEVKDKITGFSSHIQLSNYELNSSYEASPLTYNEEMIRSIRSIQHIKHVQTYASKAGIIKANNQIEGVILKGVSKDFNWDFFKEHLTEGDVINFYDTVISNDIILSQYLAKRLHIEVGMHINMYFISDNIRARGRKFKVSGIYQTDLIEFDKLFLLGDIRHIQKLNQWNEDQIGGYEIFIDDLDQLDESFEKIQKIAGYDLKTTTINQKYPQIIEWLKLHDVNVMVIIGLMVLISGVTMISMLLILILERTSLIAILKSLGATSVKIRNIFIYHIAFITGRGLLIGNIIGLTLCFIQDHFGIVALNPESYYVSVVPIYWSWWAFILVNTGTFLLTCLMIIFPSMIISRISPIKVLRFR